MTHITLKALKQIGLTDDHAKLAMMALHKSQLSGEQIGMHRGYKLDEAVQVFKSKAGGTTRQPEASRVVLDALKDTILKEAV